MVLPEHYPQLSRRAQVASQTGQLADQRSPPLLQTAREQQQHTGVCRHPSGQEQQPRTSPHTRGSPPLQLHGRTHPLSCSPPSSCPLCTSTVSADGHLLWGGTGRHGPLTAKLRPPRCKHMQPHCDHVQDIMAPMSSHVHGPFKFKVQI